VGVDRVEPEPHRDGGVVGAARVSPPLRGRCCIGGGPGTKRHELVPEARHVTVLVSSECPHALECSYEEPPFFAPGRPSLAALLESYPRSASTTLRRCFVEFSVQHFGLLYGPYSPEYGKPERR